MVFRSSLVANDFRLSKSPYLASIALTAIGSIGVIVLFVLGLYIFKDGLFGYTKSPFYRVYGVLNVFLMMLYGTNNIISTFYFLLNIYKIKGLRMNAFFVDWLHGHDGFRLLFNMSANILVIVMGIMTIATQSQDGIQSHIFCKHQIIKLTKRW